MPPAPVLVLDFDGTMTDAEAEGLPFRAGYLDDLATLVGRNAGDPELAQLADEVEAELAANPAAHPFQWMGRSVAPATVDPYLRMVPIANRILDYFGAFPGATDRGRLCGGVLYKYNYAKTLGHPVFRPGAAAAFRALANHEVFVVTNSDTHAVAGKITGLDSQEPGCAWLAPRVFGFARKFDVDDSWTGVSETLTLPGLDRPVLLRRRMYHDILAGILERTGRTFNDLIVVGDIFELDLALPLALGARVGLMTSARTPKYELDFVNAHHRAKALSGVGEIAAFAFGA